MKEEKLSGKTRVLPIIVLIIIIALWVLVSQLQLFPESEFPSPQSVVRGFGEEIKAGRLFDDLIASLFRVTTGFALAVVLGIPVGLLLGNHARARRALLPTVNFFRNLSPLAWIPFAILWFGIGDRPAIFLIFMTSFFPIVLATIAAVASIPTVFFRVAENYGYRGTELLTKVTLPAIAPQVITALRPLVGPVVAAY